MSLDREAVYSALATLVFTDPRIDNAQGGLFLTTGRLLPNFETVDPNIMPALFMFQLPESRVYYGKGAEPKRILHCIFAAYVYSADPASVLPATLVNAAADVLDNVMTPANPQHNQDLGGLVEWCRLAPDIKPFEGLLQSKSILIAAVEILVP